MIKRYLFKLLGTHLYLKIISFVYITLVSCGFYKKKYPELFYLKKLLKKGYNCIDIGANVGYYSVFISKIIGERGKLFCVEPVPLFAEVLNQNLKIFGRKNFSILQFALGQTCGRVKMNTPVIDGIFRHGMTKIIDISEDFNYTYDVEMKTPEVLFSQIGQIDFIKCDVEGYEVNIIPAFINILKKFYPLLQIEIGSDANKIAIYNLLNEIGYKCYVLLDGKLINCSDISEVLKIKDRDYYFIKN